MRVPDFLFRVPSVFGGLFAALLLCSPLAARDLEPVGASPRQGGDTAMASGLAEQALALADEFRLTPAQRVLIGLLVRSAVDDALDIGAELAAGRRDMNALLRADPVDPAAIEAQAAVQGRRMGELTALVVDTLIAARRALTEDQRLMLVELGDRLEAGFGALQGEVGVAAARRAMDRLEMRRAELGDRLELSAEQRAAIRRIIDASAPEALSIAAELAANRNALGEAIRNAPDDRTTIDALIDAQVVLFEALALLRADVVLQVRDELSEEQRMRIEQLRRMVEQRIAEWFGSL